MSRLHAFFAVRSEVRPQRDGSSNVAWRLTFSTAMLHDDDCNASTMVASVSPGGEEVALATHGAKQPIPCLIKPAAPIDQRFTGSGDRTSSVTSMN